jgi:hypothetical protein
MIKRASIKDLLDIQLSTKMEISGLDNHLDVINANVIKIITLLSSLLPSLFLQSVGEAKTDKKKILDTLSKILEHTMLLCNACNFEIPDEEELNNYEELVSLDIRNDSILTVMEMLGSMTDITMILALDMDTAIWSEDELPDEFVDNMYCIIIGIKNLGKKYGFTVDDILEKMVD